VKKSFSLKDLYKHGLKLAVTAILLSLCFYYLDFSLVLDVMRNTGVEVYSICLLITFVGTILLPSVVTWKSLSTGSITISLAQLVQINLAVRFYMMILPRVVAIGIRWFRYQKMGSGYDAAALIVFERLLQLLVLALSTTIFLALDIETAGQQGIGLLVMSTGVTVLFLTLLLMYLSPAFCWIIDWVLRKFSQYLPAVINHKIDKIWGSVKAFNIISKRLVFEIIILSILGFVLFMLSAWVLMKGMHLDVALISLIWIRSIVFFITLLPISIGGIGVREVSFIYFLSLAGVSEENAFAYSLSMLAIQLLIGLMGVLTEIFNLFKSKQAIKSP
jgi:uncharacterized membrane protein YbhN (UPF0104 family)